VKEAERKLSKEVCISRDRYGPLLKELILEGLIRMLEPIVYVRYSTADPGACKGTES
jgi:hypothetical protein